ncbi:MAG: hypothetical protein ABSF73_06875 [Terriglobia bacterium]|jgi:hypothetical protein
MRLEGLRVPKPHSYSTYVEVQAQEESNLSAISAAQLSEVLSAPRVL